MKGRPDLVRAEINLARRKWGAVDAEKSAELRKLLYRYHLSVALGDLLYIQTRWYVTHSGLLRLAYRNRCSGIRTVLEKHCSDPIARRWVFKAIVYKSRLSEGFVGYGDADPSNVSPLVHGAEMRVAETRAVNRALRKAYGIGLCSVEEIGSFPSAIEPVRGKQNPSRPAGTNGSGNGQPRLRDRLCLLIRQHQLDPTLVKLYAADYCGTTVLRDAGRDLVESFINNLAEWAANDREGLLCKLHSYAQPQEVKP